LGEAGRRVGEPSQQRTVSVEDGTLWHKKVSVAWVVRDAAEKYVVEQGPLLERQQ